MKKIVSTILSTVFTATVFGQITTTRVAPKAEQIDSSPYDSSKNFLGADPQKYIGLELYLNGMAESLQKYGYRNFYVDYKKTPLSSKSNIYKSTDSYSSKYNELAGKYFMVMDVIKHPKASENEREYGKKFYLKIQEKEGKDVIYFEYNAEFESEFPFIVVSFFNKLKQTEIGKEFTVRGRNWVSSDAMMDMKTGKPLSNFDAGGKWKCVDVTIEDRYYTLSLILENNKGEQIPLGFKKSKIKYWAFELPEAEEYRKRFGDENWQLILEGKLKIGMTNEMCELSWGKPKSINETVTSGKKTEQWVYSDNYLYFDNGLLTAKQ